MSSKRSRRNEATLPAARTAAAANPASEPPSEGTEPTSTRIASIATAVAVIAAAFAVDPGAAAAFDAPKWLLVRLAILVATAALLWGRLASAVWQPLQWRQWRRSQLGSVVLLLLTAALALLSAWQSVHQLLVWRVLLDVAVVIMLLFVGASSALDGASGRRVLWVVLVAGSITALLSLLQAAGMTLPIETAQLGGRYPTGALLGNEGYVALVAALIAVVAIALCFARPALRPARGWMALVVLLAVAAIAINQQATSAAALVFGLAVMAAVRWRQRWIAVIMLGAVALVVATAAVPTLRSVTWATLPGMDGERWQRLTTYRLGGWVAAEEMVRTSPWFGRGPGSFAEESTVRRYDAELRSRQRFLQPTGATFVYAHQDWLQLAAEIGLPALFCALGAFTLVYLRLFRAASAARTDFEPMALLGVLSAGLIMTLAWFPMQIPITAIVLLLSLGRAWRLSSTARDNSEVAP